MSGALDLVQGVVMSGMGVSLVALSARFWADRNAIERGALVFLSLAGVAAVFWQGPSLLGLVEDQFPIVEDMETAFFFLISAALFVWSSALLARHAGLLSSSLAAEREAVRQKQTYLDILGHDVRNPLTAAMLQIDVLAMKNAALKPDLQKTRASLQRIDQIVGDSLVYSKLDASAELARTVPLLEVATKAAAALEPAAAQKRVTVRLSAEDVLDTRVHPLFQHSIENLLSNAIKWSHEGSTVDLCVEANGVRVVDHGPGVPDDIKLTLFRRFERGSPGSVSGHGLGLAIAARLADAHGGRAWVEDTPGGGATFVVTV